MTELTGGSSFGDSSGVTEGSNGRSPISALDGLRGIGCLLVVLLHSWTIVPLDVIEDAGPLLGLFKSGSLGVTLFLALGGFLVTNKLLGEIDRDGTITVDRFWMRRLVRLGSQLYPLLLVMLVVSWFDRWSPWTTHQDQRSLLTAGTFTLNWSLIDDPTGNRPDIGHLWYLSVEQQFYVAWIFVLAWFGRFRAWLMGGLAVATVAVFVWRFHVIDVAGAGTASLRTTTRIDGVLLGALAALALPHVRRFGSAAAAVRLPCLVTLGVLVLLSSELDPYAFLETQGIVFALVVTLLVLAIVVANDSKGVTERLLGLRPLVLLGRISFPLYLWHYPVFWASSRWAVDMSWQMRAIASVIVLAAIVFVMDRFVERPVVRWLAHVRDRQPTFDTRPTTQGMVPTP